MVRGAGLVARTTLEPREAIEGLGAQHDLVAAEHEAGAFDPLGGNCGHRRRLPRYHAHVCRTGSLSADHVPFERCANARIVRDCLGWMQLITLHNQVLRWRRGWDSNPRYA